MLRKGKSICLVFVWFCFVLFVISSVSHMQMDGQLPIQIWAVVIVLNGFLKRKKKKKEKETKDMKLKERGSWRS